MLVSPSFNKKLELHPQISSSVGRKYGYMMVPHMITLD